MRAAIFAVLVACYDPSASECVYQCAADRERSCPSGLTCNAQNLCVSTATQTCSAADFTLAVTPSPARIVQGMSEPATVTLTRNGYAGDVTVNVTGLPAGVTADPLVIEEGNDTGSLVLRSTASATLGSSAMATVSGDGGGTMKTAMLQVFVQGPRGALDTTFNGTGTLVVPLGTSTENDAAYGVAILPNGKIIVVGSGTNSSVNFAAAIAITPAGALDTTMFTAGKHVGAYTSGTQTADQFMSVAAQSDGKFLASGYAGVSGQSHFFLLARFTAQGVLDTTFNGSGFNVTDFDTSLGDDAKAFAMTIKPNGSIVLGGFYCGTTCGGATARYSSAGAFVGRLPALPTDYQAGFAARPDGSVLVVGAQGAKIGLSRYTTSDTLDTSFANGTGTTTAVLRNAGSDVPVSVNLMPDNSFYVGAATKNGANYEAAVARFTEAGVLDTTFGGTGYVTTPTNSPLFDKVSATALQEDGSVILAYTLRQTSTDFAWVRVRKDGTIDPVPNVVSTDFGAGNDVARAVAIQPDGRIIVVGTAAANGRNNFGVARYWP